MIPADDGFLWFVGIVMNCYSDMFPVLYMDSFSSETGTKAWMNNDRETIDNESCMHPLRDETRWP